MNGPRTLTAGGPDRAAARLFAHRVILAPMVRADELPFRLLCLDGGADVVYTPEIFADKLAGAAHLPGTR